MKKIDSVVKICYNFVNCSSLQNNRALTNVLTQTLTGVITPVLGLFFFLINPLGEEIRW